MIIDLITDYASSNGEWSRQYSWRMLKRLGRSEIRKRLQRSWAPGCQVEDAANMTSRDFSGMDLRGVKWMEGADLRYCNFSGANLQGASLKGAHIEYSCFDKADLRGADFSNVKAKGATFKLAKKYMMKVLGAQDLDLWGVDGKV